jgi:hypothetical protein
MTKPKLPKKMTVAQKRKLFKALTPGSMVNITFAPIDAFEIDFDGDITMDRSGVTLPREMLSAIAGRTSEQFEVDSDWDDEDGGNPGFYQDGDDFYFEPGDPCIHAITIAKHGKKVRRLLLRSLDETLEIREGEPHITIGCRTLDKEDAEKAATAIFEWLGYEVEK